MRRECQAFLGVCIVFLGPAGVMIGLVLGGAVQASPALVGLMAICTVWAFIGVVGGAVWLRRP